jgi:hypothetical protein
VAEVRCDRRPKGVEISLAGVGSKLPHHLPAGEVVISMRPVSVFAKGPDCEIEQLRAGLINEYHHAA